MEAKADSAELQLEGEPYDFDDVEGTEAEERRKARRRYTIDRRISERRRRYWWSVIFPIIVAVCLGALISWGAYVTHVTYTISANYEINFERHIEDRAKKDAAIEHEIELMRTDYTNKLQSLRDDMNGNFKEIRDSNIRIYNLLLKHETRTPGTPMR